jgi:hypothetical protein
MKVKVYAERITLDRDYIVEVIDGRAKDGVVRKLDPRLDLYNHSPTGFCWGTNGSGPAQSGQRGGMDKPL